MTNTTGGVDSRVSNAIADYIADIPDTMSVEQIQDVVIRTSNSESFQNR